MARAQNDATCAAMKLTGRFTLTKKIGLLLLIPVAASFVSLGLFVRFLTVTRTDSHFMNVAGRQRMLSVELRDWIHMVAIGQEEDREGLQARIAEFDRALAVIDHGGEIMDQYLAPAPREVHSQLRAVEDRWREMKPDLITVAARPREEFQFKEAYRRLQRRLDDLRDLSHQVVLAFGVRGDRLRSQMLQVDGIIAGLLSGVFIAGILLTHRYIVQPVLRIGYATQRITAGDFSQRLEVTTQDELATLAGTFNNMTAEVERLLVALEFQRKHAEKILASVPVGMLLVDKQFRVRSVNHSFLESCRCEKEALVDRPVVDVLGVPELEQHLCHVLATDETQFGLLYTARCPSTAAPRPVRITVTGIGHEEEEIVLVEDLTREEQLAAERKSLEAQFYQVQKMEAIGQLAGGIAHDFNNILTGIAGYAEMLLLKVDQTSDLAGDIEQIRKSVDRAAGLTRQLLTFSRRQPVQTVVTHLNQVVEETLSMLGPLIGEDIESKFFPAPDLASVEADPGQMQQVLMNLAVNARDAMPKGGKLLIETANVEVGPEQTYLATELIPGPYVMLAVSDTGCGMDKETQNRIFEPFFTTKEVGKGTGLGLATVYGIVKEHDGHISLYSEVGRGTTFKIYLPTVDATQSSTGRVSLLEMEAKLASATGAGSQSLTGGTILVVEDEKAILDLVGRYLRQLGYRVLSASTPDDAEKLFERHGSEIGLLITDVILPGITGRQLYQRVAAMRPSLKVLYMSGYTERAVVEAAISQGACFLQKPFSLGTLQERILQLAGEPAAGAEMRPKILVADDEPAVVATLKRYLESKNYFVVTAADGFDALTQVKQENPSVVLLDIQMPGKDGIQVLKELKESGSNVGIIMITGVTEESIGRQALALGAFDYIIKPFDLDYLEKVLWWKLQLL